MLARQNQFCEAVETAEKVAALEPKNLRVLAGVVGHCHQCRPCRNGAEAPALAAWHWFPAMCSCAACWHRNLHNLGRYEEAPQEWSSLAAQNDKDEHALLGRVKALLAIGKPGQAITDTMKLLELAPGDSIYAYYNALGSMGLHRHTSRWR